MRIIKAGVKLITVSIVLVLLVVGGIGTKYLVEGYNLYQEVTSEESIHEKVQIIRQDEMYIDTSEVSPYFKEALIAVEDHRFYEHGGVDLIGLGRALLTNIKNQEIVQGGSTISQQLAKNMYFGHEQTVTRKVAELFVAVAIEEAYEKEDILEMYMNLIYFGRGCYGIQEASQTYYDKEPIALTLEESAYLAGLPQAPSVYAEDHALATQRQQVVLEAMGHTTE